MSTAGKVLVVCVILALIGWLFLMSMTARLNDNWGRVVKEQSEKLDRLSADLVKTREDLAKLKNDIAFFQEVRDKNIVTHRVEVADREKTLSETIETLERVKNQAKGQQEAEATAEAVKKQRNDEKAATEKAIADARDDVRRLIAENDELMKQFENLQQNFIKTRGENESLTRRIATH